MLMVEHQQAYDRLQLSIRHWATTNETVIAILVVGSRVRKCPLVTGTKNGIFTFPGFSQQHLLHSVQATLDIVRYLATSIEENTGEILLTSGRRKVMNMIVTICERPSDTLSGSSV